MALALAASPPVAMEGSSGTDDGRSSGNRYCEKLLRRFEPVDDRTGITGKGDPSWLLTEEALNSPVDSLCGEGELPEEEQT